MDQPKCEQPANWERTACSIKCQRINEYITIVVNRDWTAHCAWHLRHVVNTNGQGVPAKAAQCPGAGCPAVVDYRQKLMDEHRQEG